MTTNFSLTTPSFTLFRSSGNQLDGSVAAVLWGVVSRTCSVQLTAFLCNCRQAFSLLG